MQGAGDYLRGLVHLHRLSDADERRTTFRQSMATLARIAAESPALPLEGLPPEALVASVRAAMSAGLVDDLDFLSESGAALAVYELASALPEGAERRELGRMVLERLSGGEAATFVALSTRLALGPSRALAGPAMRARVALALDLPLGEGLPADALALALISRRDLGRDWLTVPSTGALPSRRLAAKLLERAAREAVRRAGGEDDSGLRAFEGPGVRAAWDRLFGDREPLVWRHVAAARGLLSSVSRPHLDEIGRDLDPALSPTEWRRAAASVAAMVAFKPEAALGKARRILAGRLLKLDRGIAGAMVLGLPRAAETEPEAAEELLETCVAFGGVDAIEALVDLRRERIRGGFGLAAAGLARDRLAELATRGDEPDEGAAALAEALLEELAAPEERAETSLRARLLEAMAAFANGGAADAHALSGGALEAAESALERLASAGDDTAAGRRGGFLALRELDAGLLETSALQDLLLLGARGEDPSPAVGPLDAIFERLARLLAASEREPVRAGAAVRHPTLRLRRLRAMLHLVDADGGAVLGRGAGIRGRRLDMAGLLLRRARDDAPGPLDRTVCAAAARACDALLREQVAELSDVYVAASSHLLTDERLTIFAEASMVPEVEAVVRAHLGLARAVSAGRPHEEVLGALLELAQAMPPSSSRRVEALRHALLSYARSLDAVASASCLGELAEGSETRPLAMTESASRALAMLVAGARRRLGLGEPEEAPAGPAAVRLVGIALDRALAGQGAGLDEALRTASELLREELPEPLAGAATAALGRIPGLPLEPPATGSRAARRRAADGTSPLPPWIPPGRVLGGFYVLRALGTGATASVLVVRRVEHRNDEGAETFALKVPAYDGSAARALSEAQFLEMFRAEAGALLAIPPHPNLARFVTFDAGAKPKPILVMELVPGPTLEHVVAAGELDGHLSLGVLDGVAAGLEAMHSVGVGHLDLKPSNVILREERGRQPRPVLVDFGLSGRSVRPGCGTPQYAAPEIWGAGPAAAPLATAADLYAFGCLAFEVATGRTLFEAATVPEVRELHLGHDGWPAPLERLGRRPGGAGLAELVRATLRREPGARIGISEVRARLAALPGRSLGVDLTGPVR